MVTRKRVARIAEGRGVREEISALKTRLRRLEDAIQPSRPRAVKVDRVKAGRRWESDTQQARQKAIDEYHARQEREYLKLNPDIVRRLQERRDKLNEYLRKKGFAPEPDIDD